MRCACVSVLVVLAVCATAGAVAAPAALAGANEIAYRCDLDICLLDPDQPSSVTNLTDNGGASFDEKPAWSPDGTRVAFVSNFGGSARNVFVMQPGAQGDSINLATQLTHYSVNVPILDLSWAPDGGRIAYTRGTSDANYGVYVANSDGTSTDPLTIAGEGQGRHPTWSADSSTIAFSKGEQVYLESSAGGVASPLANGGGHDPVWSWDGSRIAFDQINSTPPFVDLHVVSATGGGTPVIVPDSFSQWTFAAWSPDSTRLAYRATTGGDAYIRVVNGDGGGDHPLASLASHNVYAPSWSPDGSRVVVGGFAASPTSTNDIFVANADGTGVLQSLTSDGKSFEPVWRVVRSTPQAPSHGTGKPKIVWFTKRIPWTPGTPIFVGIYGCGGPSCGVSTEGKSKGGVVAGLTVRPWARAAAKPKGKKSRWVVVGRSQMKVPGGAKRKLKLRLNKLGEAAIRKLGKLTIKVTVTTASPGKRKVKQTHTIHVYFKRPARHHGR